MIDQDIDQVELAKTLTRLEVGQAAIRTDLTRYFAESKKVHEYTDKRLGKLEQTTAVQQQQIDGLSTRVNAWSIVNSIGVAISGIIGWNK